MVEGLAETALIERVLEAYELLRQGWPSGDEEDHQLFALALSEVTTNIIQHSRTDTAVTLTARMTLTPEGAGACLTDDAIPAHLDWDSIAMPEADSESGRGLALAQAVLDEFSHEPSPGGNIWRLGRSFGVRS
ncbi:ATP-binding protein [Tessaracoccus sp. MC1865]|uniref:ATP-binding protein n=1 Tax=Tessaracoccus sp. MC1865 TaxID=2760310 RepID=UPI00160345F2|nr:ATP-binding protein [Tessaracoccus sp. MC1865]MBB1484469.1 ATP-binding protein [Tessaracoccus sp. MC1865]QTO38428.1 ATP-binding protein [Tessaracoccus sp. MC1865]